MYPIPFSVNGENRERNIPKQYAIDLIAKAGG